MKTETTKTWFVVFSVRNGIAWLNVRGLKSTKRVLLAVGNLRKGDEIELSEAEIANSDLNFDTRAAQYAAPTNQGKSLTTQNT